MTQQRVFPFVLSGPKAPQFYPLYAPTSDGFFSLSDLHEFCTSQLDPLVGIETTTTFVLDFQSIRVWDISALLWLALALQYYRSRRVPFQLRLPEADSVAASDEQDSAQKSADFLRRWRFDRAIAHVGDLAEMLVSEQKDYFVGGPRVFYKEGQRTHIYQGLEEKLLTNRLVEIRDLTEQSSKAQGSRISDAEVEKCIREFHDAHIGNILRSNCNISTEDAEAFADHLVTESLLNVQQHPNASSAFLSVVVLGRSRELILTVADNGDSIPNTILAVYNKKHGTDYSLGTIPDLPLDERSAVLDFATQPYVSRKQKTDKEVGLGLTYIKEDTVDRFKGKLRIIAESVQAIYQHDSKAPPHPLEWRHQWKGNLLRISIPLKKGRV